MAKGVHILLERSQGYGVDVEAMLRLAAYFAFHLSNFDFKWAWTQWYAFPSPRVYFFFPCCSIFLCKFPSICCLPLTFEFLLASSKREVYVAMPKYDLRRLFVTEVVARLIR
jgi:hypothetical protein